MGCLHGRGAPQAQEAAGPPQAQEAAGPPQAQEAAGPPQAQETAGPPQAQEAAGPPQAQEAAGPPQAQEAAGPPQAGHGAIDHGQRECRAMAEPLVLIKRIRAAASQVLQPRFVTWLPPFGCRGLGDLCCAEPGLVVVPSGAGLVAAPPS